MTKISKPDVKPNNPRFSSGPCTKHPNWSITNLDKFVGRAHRSASGEVRLKSAIDLTREVLQVPDTYRIGIVPASQTGAMEMAMWTLLGARSVTAIAWEKFGSEWLQDIRDELKLPDAKLLEADYGDIVDFATIDFSSDVIFTWNGTTSGVRLPDGLSIPESREGLTICDATSAAFAYDLPFSKLDVTTFSWQKVMGGEAGHGMIILSPRAVDRLESHTPSWPIPKIFRLTSEGKLLEDIFRGVTINTPSMLCLDDYIDALNWAKSIGGLESLISRTNANFATLDSWVTSSDWVDYLAIDPATRSKTSVCLSIVHPSFTSLAESAQRSFISDLSDLLSDHGAAYDIVGHRHAPIGLRIWCGATVEKSDLRILTNWLDWGLNELIG